MSAPSAPHDDEFSPARIAARLDRLPLSGWHWKLTVLVGLAAFFDVYEIFMGGVLSSVLTKPWGLGQSAKAMLIGAPFFGMIVGAIGLGLACDLWGRRRLFMFSLAAYSLLSVASAFSPNVETLIMIRLLCGIFMGAELILLDTYLSEFMPKSVRGRMIAVAYAIGFLGTPLVSGLGGLVIAPSHFLWDGWRWVLVLGGLGALVVFILRRNLPESPRWLAEKGLGPKADTIVTEIERAVVARSGKPLDDVPAVPSDTWRRMRFAEMFRPPYARRTWMLWIFQLLQTVGYYGFGSLAPIILVAKGYTVTQSLAYVTLSFVGAPLGALIAVPLVERFERKWLIVSSALLSAAAGFTFGTSSTPAIIAVAGLVTTMANIVMSSSFHIYQAELFPTQIRSTAIGIPYALSRVTSALLPFGSLALLAEFGPIGVFTGSAALLVVMCISTGVLGPKTNGRSLESVTGTAAQGQNLVGENA